MLHMSSLTFWGLIANVILCPSPKLPNTGYRTIGKLYITIAFFAASYRVSSGIPSYASRFIPMFRRLLATDVYPKRLADSVPVLFGNCELMMAISFPQISQSGEKLFSLVTSFILHCCGGIGFCTRSETLFFCCKYKWCFCFPLLYISLLLRVWLEGWGPLAQSKCGARLFFLWHGAVFVLRLANAMENAATHINSLRIGRDLDDGIVTRFSKEGILNKSGISQ